MKTQMTISRRANANSFFLILLFFANSLHAVAEEGLIKKVQIDGILNEQIWIEAKEFSNLVQIEPAIFDASTVKSEFYFTYDTQNIYVAGKIYQEKNTISAVGARKDDAKTTKGDYITIGIDPLNNGNSAYFFIINPVNALADGTIDMAGNLHYSWDAIFISQTKIDDSYWTFELKIPLTSISFQNSDIQSWGVMFSRFYAHSQEFSINQLKDKNAPYRVSDFYKIDDVKGLKKDRKLILIPYIYGFSDYSKLNDALSNGSKIGGEIKYNPTPSTTILATINPDYAQIETDREVINVSDLPTTYPEKRPFFTESSDMYPGLAVNTRNITDINVGVKVRNVGRNSKIDFTTLYDKQKNLWGMGNIRLTDNNRYHFEVISGIKSANTDYFHCYNYNVTLHGKLYFFDKRLQAYSWYGTINMPTGSTNEYESVNAVKWISRTWNAGLWNHFKSDLYNPDIVGSPSFSNEFIIDGWLGYTLYSKKGFFRKTTFTSHVLRNDLFFNKGNEYYENMNTVNNQLYLGKTWGNWEIEVVYEPGLSGKFRYRNQMQFNNRNVFADAKSPFVLIKQSANTFNVTFKTDASKTIGFELSYDNNLVRKSKSNNYSIESFLNIGSKAIIAYSYKFVDIAGSDFQEKYRQSIHRLKAEYNFTSTANFRFIYQPNCVELPMENNVNQNYILNMTFSWEFMPGTNFHVVYNNYRKFDQYNNGPRDFSNNNHTLLLKISKSI